MSKLFGNAPKAQASASFTDEQVQTVWQKEFADLQEEIAGRNSRLAAVAEFAGLPSIAGRIAGRTPDLLDLARNLQSCRLAKK